MPQAILLADHENLGAKGTVVDVSKGYLRNYLIPRKIAEPATRGALAAAERRAVVAERAVADATAKAEESAALLNKTVLTIAHQAGDDGRLFGAVTSQDIADAIKEARGITIDKRHVHLEEPIKSVGTRMVVVEVEQRRHRHRQDHGGRAEVAPGRGTLRSLRLRTYVRSDPEPRLGCPVSTPERIHTNGNSVPRLPEGPIAPPQNLEAEQSVLGAVLLSDTALPALIIDERLHPEDFYREAHGIVFAAMLDLHSGGEPVDALTLVEHLKQAGKLEQAGGRSAIDLLASSVPAVGHVRQYARIVRENAMLRRLLRAAYEIQARVHSHDAPPRELVDIAERSILEVAHEDSRKDFRAINDVLDVEITKLEQLSQEGKAITGTPSGFDDLDNITGGFQPGNLIVLAARPSMGKSALMANFAENAALGSTRPSPCSRSRCRSPSSPSASSPRRRRSRATTCARGACRRRAGARSWRRRTGSRSRRSSSTTRPTSRCSTCGPRRAGCCSSTPTGWG